MLYKWTCRSSSGSYGDLTAAQLREMAANRAIQPADYIGSAPMVAAYKFRDLFPNTAFLEINWRGGLDGSTAPVTVSLNNYVLGTVPVGPGFCFWHEVQLGQHLVGVKLSFKSQKKYVVNVPRSGIYCCDLLFGGGFWANFQNQCNVYDQPAQFFDEGQTLNSWEAERRAARCEHCGAEWAVVHLGQKVLNEEERYKTRCEPQYQWVECPYQSPYGPTQYEMLPTGNVTSQIVVIVMTVRDNFQCQRCGKKWKHDSTHERMP